MIQPRNAMEASLAIRAAWLHYVGRLTQAEVAKKLGVSGVKAHRLIARATQEGAVKFVIDGDIAECVALESSLFERYSLDYCEVVPRVSDDMLPLRELGVAGAAFLQREMETGSNDLIGLGHGRTLSATVHQLPSITSKGVRFVSLLGGLTKNFSANPHDVMHHLAAKTGAEAYVMPVPFFANRVEDREVLLNQRGVVEVMEMAARSSLKFVGIGTAEPSAQLVSSGMIEREEIQQVKALGAYGELLGHFFNENGESLETSLTARTLSVALSDMQSSRIVAVAGGNEKVRAIEAILRSGLISGLITDERTASALMVD
ncbi:MAG: sugar-binding transcriptional regulator [Granulosicoccus sp.]|nr:sugar-binding transcriptional regulator [Granulosicoccus sp.]